MLFEKNDKVLFIGDSISDFGRARPVGEGLGDALGTSYVSLIASLLKSTNPDLNLRIVNMGISGNTTKDLVDRWQTDVIDLDPQWVSVLIGINDVWRQFDMPAQVERHVYPDEFEKNYRDIIEATLRKGVKGMVLMTPYFMVTEKSDPMRKQMDVYGAIVKKLAEEYKLIFVDLQKEYDKLFKSVHPVSVAWDRIHPNQVGHMLIARAFLKSVGYKW